MQQLWGASFAARFNEVHTVVNLPEVLLEGVSVRLPGALFDSRRRCECAFNLDWPGAEGPPQSGCKNMSLQSHSWISEHARQRTRMCFGQMFKVLKDWKAMLGLQ